VDKEGLIAEEGAKVVKANIRQLIRRMPNLMKRVQEENNIPEEEEEIHKWLRNPSCPGKKRTYFPKMAKPKRERTKMGISLTNKNNKMDRKREGKDKMDQAKKRRPILERNSRAREGSPEGLVKRQRKEGRKIMGEIKIYQSKECQKRPLDWTGGTRKRRRETSEVAIPGEQKDTPEVSGSQKRMGIALRDEKLVDPEACHGERPEKPEWSSRTMVTRAMTQGNRRRVSETRRQQQESSQGNKLCMQERKWRSRQNQGSEG